MPENNQQQKPPEEKVKEVLETDSVASPTPRKLSKLLDLTSSKFFQIAFTIFLLLTLFGTTFAVAYLTQQKRQEAPTAGQDIVPESEIKLPETDETANWKTYTNKDYSFSVSYPSMWEFGESTSDGYPYIIFQDPIAQQINLPQTEIDKGAMIQIYMTDASLYTVQPVTLSSLKDIFLGVDLSKGMYADPDAKQEVGEETVGNLTGVKETINQKYYSSQTFAFIKEYMDEKIVFKISLTAFKPLSTQKLNEYNTIFNQVLSTFKFLDQEVKGVKTTLSDSCLEREQKLLEEISECEIIDEHRCLYLKEEFDSCVSGCQKDLEKKMCFDVCKPVCGN